MPTYYIPSAHVFWTAVYYGGWVSMVLGVLGLIHLVLGLVDKFRQRRRAHKRFKTIYEARRMYLMIVEAMTGSDKVSLLKHEWNDFNSFLEGYLA
jgi:vacuolar-type H+-ATPase subunit I/STV1